MKRPSSKVKTQRLFLQVGAVFVALAVLLVFRLWPAGVLHRPIVQVPAKAERVSARVPAPVRPVSTAGGRPDIAEDPWQEWVKTSAGATAAAALTLPDEAERRANLLAVMELWGAHDPAEALAWARRAPFETEYERGIMMSMACTTAARRDAAAAVRLAVEYGLDASASGLMGGLVSRWAEKDLSAACHWAAGREPGPVRDEMMTDLALVLLETDVARAPQWVLEQVPASEARDQAMLALVTRLAAQDPELARTWTGCFLAGPVRDRMQERIEAMHAAL